MYAYQGNIEQAENAFNKSEYPLEQKKYRIIEWMIKHNLWVHGADKLYYEANRGKFKRRAT